MTKNEFLETLRTSLSSELSTDKINQHINYYSSYIDEEIKKGRSEEEIFLELGSPKLIAKSIKEASFSNYDKSQETFSYTKKQTYTDDFGNEIKKDKFKIFNINSTNLALILILSIIVIFAIVSFFVSILFKIVSFIVAPIIKPLLIFIIILILYTIYKLKFKR